MTCFEIKPTEAYTGGCAVIAATTVEEAMKEFRKNSYYNDLCRAYAFSCNIIPGLEYDTITPKVIIDRIYIE